MFPDKSEKLSDGMHLGVRTKIASAVPTDFSCHENPREIFMHSDFYIGIGFIIFPHRIEMGLEAIDQPTFDDEGFAFTGRRKIIHMVNGRDERTDFGGVVGSVQEIGTDAFRQIARFPHIKNGSATITHQIDARRMRNVA